MAGRIFINYRRGDDPGYTQALFHRLEAEFGREALFMDVEGYIKPGDDFVQVLDAQVAQSDVLLVVIGPRWIDAVDETGRRRLDNPDDFVRIEIASALGQGKRVVPVLVNNAAMPRAEELPEPLKPLSRRNAVRLSHERFRTDVQGLVDELRQALGKSKPRKRQVEGERGNEANPLRRFPWLVFAILGAVAGAIGYGVSEGLQINLTGGARAVQILPAAMVGLAVAASAAICGVMPAARALLTGALAGAAWFVTDCAVIYGPLFSEQEWSATLPAAKQFVWGALNALGLLGAAAVVTPAARSPKVWAVTLIAAGATAILFSHVDALGGNATIPGAIQVAATLAAFSLAFWPES